MSESDILPSFVGTLVCITQITYISYVLGQNHGYPVTEENTSLNRRDEKKLE